MNEADANHINRIPGQAQMRAQPSMVLNTDIASHCSNLRKSQHRLNLKDHKDLQTLSPLRNKAKSRIELRFITHKSFKVDDIAVIILELHTVVRHWHRFHTGWRKAWI